ncbi:MAG TPA: hypothetical protein VJ913_10785, partial [Actinomycetota bacterium]|nr:hypothetical protein [Actinomycetota bacterium]
RLERLVQSVEAAHIAAATSPPTIAITRGSLSGSTARLGDAPGGERPPSPGHGRDLLRRQQDRRDPGADLAFGDLAGRRS